MIAGRIDVSLEAHIEVVDYKRRSLQLRLPDGRKVWLRKGDTLDLTLNKTFKQGPGGYRGSNIDTEVNGG